MFLFSDNNNKILFDNSDCLKNDIYYDKQWFILKNAGVKNINEFADYYINIKYYHITYETKIMNKIKSLQLNLKNE